MCWLDSEKREEKKRKREKKRVYSANVGEDAFIILFLMQL